MKTITRTALISVLLALTLPQAMALDKAAAKAAFDNNGCASCHQAKENNVGPSLANIAKRYKGKKVETELATRIRLGSEGRWGDMPHPAIPSLTPEDADLLVRWILAGSPTAGK
jgi:cytochrome c